MKGGLLGAFEGFGLDGEEKGNLEFHFADEGAVKLIVEASGVEGDIEIFYEGGFIFGCFEVVGVLAKVGRKRGGEITLGFGENTREGGAKGAEIG